MKPTIYWRETEPVTPGPPLTADADCDVCIVGGGFTGLWTAYFLTSADPDLRVRVLEAEYAGAGASGHSDGFVTPTIGHSLHALVSRFGAPAAAAAYWAVGRSILELDRFCRKHEVDADLDVGGFYVVATNRGQRRRLEHDLRLAQEVGAPLSVGLLEDDEARACIGSPVIQAAVRSGGGLVNPHRLVRGLARVAARQGVAIHEQTPVAGVQRDGDAYVLDTPGARVRAQRVVLATNAYQHTFKAFRRKLLPVWSYALVSEPLTDAQRERVHWPGGEGFVESRNFVVFGRPVAGNRILWGGGRAPYRLGRDMDPARIRNRRVEGDLMRSFRRAFPMWRDVRFSHSYGGCVAMTRDLVPHLGRAGSGLYYGYGYCGNGIALSHTAGKVLRDLVLERSTQLTRLLFVDRDEREFPPEPLAFLGARSLSAVLALQDRYPGVVSRPLV